MNIFIKSILVISVLSIYCGQPTYPIQEFELIPLNRGNYWRLVISEYVDDPSGYWFVIPNEVSNDSITMPPEVRDIIIGKVYYIQQLQFIGNDELLIHERSIDYIAKCENGYVLGLNRGIYFIQYPIINESYTFSYSKRFQTELTTVRCDVTIDNCNWQGYDHIRNNYLFDNRTMFSFSEGIGFIQYIENNHIDLIRYVYKLDSLKIY